MSGGGRIGGSAVPPAGFDTACVLLRMLPAAEALRPSLMMSILRALAANPAICNTMPKYDPPLRSELPPWKKRWPPKVGRAADEFDRAHHRPGEGHKRFIPVVDHMGKMVRGEQLQFSVQWEWSATRRPARPAPVL